MKRFFILLFTVYSGILGAQTPRTYTSSEILQQVKKLNVLGAVLYIAAHPDDENTRLLAYLANEKLYRTGYLSLTRGDGGQNLIGEELGLDLGLIRTQELLAARRIDGAEQFFTRAYDFGFSKSSTEALGIWGHDKILSDVVWVIRKFRPDVIIARFPEDSRAGHGHHAASGILAREAFDAAADPAKFPEQLRRGVTVWQAKRLLWNTFNFGGNSTQNENQFKVDVGMYNPLLGKSYGEIAALSRSQHKSQGFGVPAQRGAVLEYFETIRGEKPVNDLVDGVNVSWEKIGLGNMEDSIRALIENYDLQRPSASLTSLVRLYTAVQKSGNGYWQQQKLKEIQHIIEAASGLFMEATANSGYAVQGDSVKITTLVNNRAGINAQVQSVDFFGHSAKLDSLKPNTNISTITPVWINPAEPLTQPYWLAMPMDKGSFNVADQQLIGKSDSDPLSVSFKVNIEGLDLVFKKPLRYKFTDPVKGEVYQPVYVFPPLTLNVTPAVNIINPANGAAPGVLTEHYLLHTDGKNLKPIGEQHSALSKLSRNARYTHSVPLAGMDTLPKNTLVERRYDDFMDVKEISYDHIPAIKYFIQPGYAVLVADVKRNGKNIGYIQGAGDKVPQALEQMGYRVTLLKETDITFNNLQQFDAVVSGIRAYNTNDWMSNVYETLMRYVEEGGVLLAQYNTSNFISNVKSKIGPYPFSISRSRVTDENAPVNFLLPDHPVLNYPNKITKKDFEGWIQERSVYHADKIDSNYQRIISMNDPGEKEDDGSLIVANYGKGRFVYTGLVFFRELPAGVPGAYRLFSNLIAIPPVPGKSAAGKNNSSTRKTTLTGKSSKQ
jgi:LmbE family N-acetylglucosaminyl deacetylase